jgi:hypothetical protein
MLNQEFELTAASPAVAAPIAVWPEYVRLPPPGELDPLFGLTRSYLNLLILPSKENDFRPPVRSSVLRQPNAKTGVRLVNVASLRAYVKNQTASRARRRASDSARAFRACPADLLRNRPKGSLTTRAAVRSLLGSRLARTKDSCK